MAPNKKKKKKPVNNPARGFATVSTPSKKVDDSPPELQDTPEDSSVYGKPVAVGVGQEINVASGNEASNLQHSQHMSPAELEHHLEEAELQMLLDTHAQRCKKETIRQIARLGTERRSLRRGGMMLETESWLPQVLEDILELARSFLLAQKAIKTVEDRSDDTALCVRLWTVQQTLLSLRFHEVDDVLKHLVKTSYLNTKTDSNSLIWGLDEAMNWLALSSNLGDLPAYQQEMNPQNTPPASRDRSPGFADTSDDTDSGTSSATSESQARNEASNISPTQPVSDNSDDDVNDPDDLIDKFLSAKYELLKSSLSSKGIALGSQATGQQSHRLTRRIQKIERDVLFDRDEAMARWDVFKKDIEIEHARSNALAKRRKRPDEITLSDGHGADAESVIGDSNADDDSIGGDIFGNIFASDEKTNDDSDPTTTVAITLRDFGPLGAGGNPRKVLEETCKARDQSSKLIVRRISASSHSHQNSAQITWSKDQDIAVSPSYLPSQLRYVFRPHSTTVSMVTIATTSSQQSEGYLCTVVLFILSHLTRDDKLYLRLQTVWRDLWKELQEGKQDEINRTDRDDLRHIHSLIAGERLMQEPEGNERSKQKAPPKGSTERSKPLERRGFDHSPKALQSMWMEKTSTMQYQKMLKIRQQLPIWEHCDLIVDTISANQVSILCAETGAGKSTQVPSFILQKHLNDGQDCKVLITQPRRISAISLARRVSEELGEAKFEIGTRQSLVGYAIRLESKISSSTRVTYVTTGVLLRMLESSKNLEEVDFLILDEVHERSMDLDLLFIALRRLLQRRQSFKIVLMSATVDARRFSEYFGDAPILNIPGRTFPVDIRYLEDAMELSQTRDNNIPGPRVVETYEEDTIDRNESERTRSLTVGLESYSLQTRKALAAYDEYKIDYSLILQIIMTISSDETLSKYSWGAVLIFMPGIAEIRRLHQLIISTPAFQSGWIVHLLHSSFSNDDLERAFERPPAHHRKIVIATNIAETGITIPDVTAVIDSCREKIMRFDERRQLSKLTETFISRSSARQRRGRAARVQEGLCFHLVTRDRHDNLLLEHHVPEMLRLSLQDPILRIKVWNLGNIEQTLTEAFDPPTSRNVRRAVQLLKDVNALTDSESLTSLGRQLAKLPLDIWLGKLVLHGVTFGCLDAAVFIAAMLSAKSPFTDNGRSDSRAMAARLAFSKGNSDLLLVYNAYCAWRRACLAGNVHEFCRKNFLNYSTLSQIEDQKVQLLVTLSDASLLPLNESEKATLRKSRFGRKTSEFFTIPQRYNLNSSSEFAINSVVAMALYPKLLVRERHGWRNVANNQQVNISNTSINYRSLSSPPTNWLSFYQTMQTKSKNPTVFETGAVPEAAIVLLLGDVDFKMYAGVISLDGGRIRFSVRDWKTMIALKVLRTGIQEALSHSYRNVGLSLSPIDMKWLDIWQRIVTARKTLDG